MSGGIPSHKRRDVKEDRSRYISCTIDTCNRCRLVRASEVESKHVLVLKMPERRAADLSVQHLLNAYSAIPDESELDKQCPGCDGVMQDAEPRVTPVPQKHTRTYMLLGTMPEHLTISLDTHALAVGRTLAAVPRSISVPHSQLPPTELNQGHSHELLQLKDLGEHAKQLQDLPTTRTRYRLHAVLYHAGEDKGGHEQ